MTGFVEGVEVLPEVPYVLFLFACDRLRSSAGEKLLIGIANPAI